MFCSLRASNIIGQYKVENVRETGGRKPDKKQFFHFFEAAWREAASMATAQSGFRKLGTFPAN